jgi:hypothetical protein
VKFVGIILIAGGGLDVLIVVLANIVWMVSGERQNVDANPLQAWTAIGVGILLFNSKR